MNNDGFQDIIVNRAAQLRLAKGDGAGGFLGAQTLSTESTYGSATVDVNGDGMLDVFNQNDGTDIVRLTTSIAANGDIIQDAGTQVPDSGGLGATPYVVDFDGNGTPDVIVPPIDVDIQNCGTTEQAEVFSNDGNGNFTRATGLSVAVYDIVAVDFDGDGKPDAILSGCIDGFRYYRSDPNNMSGGGNNVFSCAFVPHPTAPNGTRFRVQNIPQVSGQGVTLYNLFDIASPLDLGAGSFFGLRPQVVTQLAIPSGAQPFNVLLSAPQTTYDFDVGAVPSIRVDAVSIALDGTAGSISFTQPVRQEF